VLDQQIELIARERVASLRREAERHRLVREASFHSPQHAARSPGRGARALRGRRLTGGGAVWLARVRTLLSRAAFELVEAAERAAPGLLRDSVGDCARADERQRDPVHRGAVGVDERAELVSVSAAEGREERGSGPGIRSEIQCSRGRNGTVGSRDCTRDGKRTRREHR
jgi:hypothetical protein